MTAPQEPVPTAGWFADPAGKHEKRYFDGRSWTDHVFDHGVQGVDALSPTPASRGMAPQQVAFNAKAALRIVGQISGVRIALLVLIALGTLAGVGASVDVGGDDAALTIVLTLVGGAISALLVSAVFGWFEQTLAALIAMASRSE